ncbi:mucin-17 [Oryctolagus cuniculus]|uniref:mucin-17 n=1 Tax=Oryctolagus cuniculus TaxID=9986 RepID=UPI00387A3ADD
MLGVCACLSKPSSLPVICENGGSWNNGTCICPNGFEGDRCQFLVDEQLCYNGGFWDGIKCQCHLPFYGPRCQEVVDSLDLEPPQMVSAVVELSVTVTSEEYSEQLQNQSSEEFKNFNETFTKQMALIYSGIPEYYGVNITRLSPGSVVVEHDVILRTTYTPQYQEVFGQATETVEEIIMNVTAKQISTNNSCPALLCFNTTATMVQNVTIDYDPEEECRQKAGPVYSPYFTVEYKDQTPYCVSPCMSDFNVSMNCNMGKCRLETTGPRCFCLITDTHWYSGETCQWATSKSLVYGLLGAAGGLLLIIIMALLVFSLRSRRKARRKQSIEPQLYQWHEEVGQEPGTFRNVTFDLHEDSSVYVNSIYSNFEPALSNIDPETRIRIQRPQVIKTSL